MCVTGYESQDGKQCCFWSDHWVGGCGSWSVTCSCHSEREAPCEVSRGGVSTACQDLCHPESHAESSRWRPAASRMSVREDHGCVVCLSSSVLSHPAPAAQLLATHLSSSCVPFLSPQRTRPWGGASTRRVTQHPGS